MYFFFKFKIAVSQLSKSLYFILCIVVVNYDFTKICIILDEKCIVLVLFLQIVKYVNRFILIIKTLKSPQQINTFHIMTIFQTFL